MTTILCTSSVRKVGILFITFSINSLLLLFETLHNDYWPSGLQAIKVRLADLMHMYIRDIIQEYWRTGTPPMSKLSLEIAEGYCFSLFCPHSLLSNFCSSYIKLSQLLHAFVVSGITQQASSRRLALFSWWSSNSILKNICQPPYIEFPCSPFLSA